MNNPEKISTIPPCLDGEGKPPNFCRPDTDKPEELNMAFKRLQARVADEVFEVISDTEAEKRKVVAIKAAPICWNKRVDITTGVKMAISLCEKN
jgi:hypothetical protein